MAPPPLKSTSPVALQVEAVTSKGRKKKKTSEQEAAVIVTASAPAPVTAADKAEEEEAHSKLRGGKHGKEGDHEGIAGIEAPPIVRILFTKMDVKLYESYKTSLEKIPNVVVTEDAAMATHCVTTAELKRTPKLMIAINAGVQYVVTEAWVKDTIHAGAVVPVPAVAAREVTATVKGKVKTKKSGSYVDSNSSKTAGAEEAGNSKAALQLRLQNSQYLVQDTEKEQLWKFQMAATLAVPRGRTVPLSSPSSSRSGGVFSSYCVYCTPGVFCQQKVPPESDLKAIVEAGGGVWLSKWKDWEAKYKNALPPPQVEINEDHVMPPPSTAASQQSSRAKRKQGSTTTATAAGTDITREGEKAPNNPTAVRRWSLLVLSHSNVVKKDVNKNILEALRVNKAETAVAVAAGAGPSAGNGNGNGTGKGRKNQTERSSSRGQVQGVYDAVEMVFLTCLRQQIDFDENILLPL